MIKLFRFTALALLALPSFAADVWTVDKPHSDVSFKVRHFVANQKGKFNDFSGTIIADSAKPQNSSVEFVIKTASIDTNDESRDKHLRSADFFDVEKFPEIIFKSTKVQPAGKNKFNVTGNLTMHGVTKSIVLPVTYFGSIKHPNGSEKGGFEATVSLDRKDFGVTWNKALDQGGAVLGDTVEVSINLETNKKPVAPAIAPLPNAPAPGTTKQ